MNKSISISKFRSLIQQLPSDQPVDNPSVWYKTQKQHWLRWLEYYHTPGAYGRVPDKSRDARYAYNHVVNYKMLLWIIEAAGVKSDLVKAARRASTSGATLQEKSAKIRKLVPWEELAGVLWGEK
jgi:hypothetical protein